MQLNLVKTSQNETVLVTFSFQNKKEKDPKHPVTTKVSHGDVSKHFQAAIDDKSISGKAQEVIVFRDCNFQNHRHVVVAGLGSTIDGEAFRVAAAGVLAAIKSLNAKNAVVTFDQVPSGKNAAGNLQALTEGLILSNYSFDELKSKKPGKPEAKTTTKKSADDSEITINIISKSDAATRKAFQEGAILGETVNFSRRLGDMPGNLMTPTILANTTVDAAKGTGLKVTVWDRARIKKEKMGGLYGVGQGSAQEPRFIIMEYKGAAAGKKPVVFVGKGLTFDTGGISLKPGAAMEEMKYDMCGGANVIGTMLAIAKLKLKINVVGLVPSSENMPGSAATKPGDIHTARNGKTFEVNNTDAEGRLILADALSYATELEPTMIVDAATLTGAMVVALGNTHTGFFTRHDALSKKVDAAATRSGELVWRMPLTDFHVKDMKGTFADLSNISSSKGAGSATAAGFLEQFVGEGIPWAHFDIAGTGWAVGSRLPYCPKRGASGCMLRTFVELAKAQQ